MSKSSRRGMLKRLIPYAADVTLRAAGVEPSPPPWRGEVRIDPQRCIAMLGPECGACAVCPEEAAGAIRFVRWKPRIDSARCNGCGACVSACPVSPKAISLHAEGADG